MNGHGNHLLKWIRPQNVPFPNVWHRFEVKTKDGQKSYKIRIEDLTTDLYDHAWKLFEEFFYTDEPARKCLNAIDNAELMALEREHKYKTFRQNVSLIAVLDDYQSTPTLVGCQGVKVISKDDPSAANEIIVDPDGRRKRLSDLLWENVNILGLLESHYYLYGSGLVVHPQFRGLNIAYHLLLAIKKMSQACGIPGAISVYSNLKSQEAAKRAGFKTLKRINYDDYTDENNQKIFSIEGTEAIKLMYQKF